MSDDDQELSQLDKTKRALSDVLEYDLSSITRREELGQTFSFERAVLPAKQIVGIFRLIPTSHLEELPEKELQIIQQAADSFTNLLESIHEFDPENPTDNTVRRDQIVDNIIGQYQPLFSKLFPLISYLTARSTDFSALETDARAAVQEAKRAAEDVVKEVRAQGSEAESTLQTIRDVAAEQGVSQQAIHFQAEADKHKKAADRWGMYTVLTAIGLGLLAIVSIFVHKWDFLTPTNLYETVQLSISKAILFGAVGYMLVVCVRNFVAHKHNEVVNRHRQNALVTFKALVDAASVEGKQDIVLMQASECIFTGRDSGFSRSAGGSPTQGAAMLQLLPRVLGSSNPADG